MADLTSSSSRQRKLPGDINPRERVFEYRQRLGDTFQRSRRPNGANSHYLKMIESRFLNPPKKEQELQHTKNKALFDSELIRQEQLEVKNKIRDSLINEMVSQKTVNFSLPSREQFFLSKIKRTPQQIIEAWGYHEDKKVTQFNSRVRSKVVVASLIQKAVQHHLLEKDKQVTPSSPQSTDSELSESELFNMEEDHFLREYLLKDAKPHQHHLVRFAKQPFQRASIGLAELDQKQIKNEMDNWSPQKFAALRDVAFADRQEKQIEQKFNKAIQKFKERTLGIQKDQTNESFALQQRNLISDSYRLTVQKVQQDRIDTAQ